MSLEAEEETIQNLFYILMMYSKHRSLLGARFSQNVSEEFSSTASCYCDSCDYLNFEQGLCGKLDFNFDYQSDAGGTTRHSKIN